MYSMQVWNEMKLRERERELQAVRQANKKFGALRSALRSSRKSRVALRLRFNSIDGGKEKEREDDEEPDVPVDVLATPSNKQTFARRSDAEVDDEADSISTGAITCNRKRAAPVSDGDQI